MVRISMKFGYLRPVSPIDHTSHELADAVYHRFNHCITSFGCSFERLFVSLVGHGVGTHVLRKSS